jgi:predicted ferric reductase
MATVTQIASTAPRRRSFPLPRVWPVRAVDVYAIVAGNAVLIVAMWIRHGGLAELGSAAGILTAAGQLAALLGTFAALLQLVLMSRAPWLDQVFGMDRLAWAHKWLGFATVWLLVGHAVATTAGYGLGDGSGFVAEAWTLLTTFPYVLLAAAGLALMVLVAVSSIRAARRRLSYETWFGLHLYAYLAVALAFAHQLVVGSDFVDDPVARLYWIGLYVVTFGLILVFRVGQPIVTSSRHRLRVANVVTEAPGVVSIYLTGRELDRLPVRAGQYFLVRFLTRDGWYRAHPFSISAAPNGKYLRITVKDLGDWTHRLQRAEIGTRVFVEGPYGIVTGARRTRRKVLLIGGGCGIAPLRSLVEALPGGPGDLAIVYRSRSWDDVVFRAELDHIARARGATLDYIVGRRGTPEVSAEPLRPAALATLVPDVTERDVYLCGPGSLMDEAHRSLRALGVADRQIHLERFSY